MACVIHLKKAQGPLALEDLDRVLTAGGEDLEKRGAGRNVRLPGNASAYLRPALAKGASGAGESGAAQTAPSIEIALEGPQESASVLIDFAFKLADDVGGPLHKFASGPAIGRGALREALVAEHEAEKDPTDGRTIAIVCGIAVMAVPFVVLVVTGFLSVKLTVLCVLGGASIAAKGRRHYF